MRIDKPGGSEVELHRRCWIGRGGGTPPGCIRVDASALGYASDLEFVFPVGSHVGLASLLRDEILTGRRRAEIAGRQHEIHEQVERLWSLRTAARALANLAKGIDTEGEGGAR